MAAPGSTDLAEMLASLGVERRPGVFTYVAVASPSPQLLAAAHATVDEGRSTTVVVPVEVAEDAGHPVVVRLAWLTLTVESSLEAVGLTAAISARLTELDISCNVLAGYHHDHLLVPLHRAEDAIDALSS